MTFRRSAAAVGAVALGLFALSACTKPTPLATVTVGDTTVHTQAERDAPCWNDGKDLSQQQIQDCINDTKAPATTIKVDSGEKVHLGVDPEISDTGWVVVLSQGPGSQPQGVTNFMSKQSYTTLTVPASALFQNQQTQSTAKFADLVFLKTTKDEADTTQVWKVRMELSS